MLVKFSLSDIQDYGKCPPQYNKSIFEKKRCINECINDETYIYEYNNNCLKECPPNVKIYEDQKKCLDECYQYQLKYNNVSQLKRKMRMFVEVN